MAKQFNIGDRIQHRKTGTCAVVLGMYEDKGYWIEEDTQARWLLQHTWTSDWKVVK
jgi:hypothetical protein